MARASGFDDDEPRRACAARPSSRPSRRTATSTTRCAQDLRGAARHARRARRSATPASCPGRAAAAPPSCAPAGAQGRDAAHADLQRRRGHASTPSASRSSRAATSPARRWTRDTLRLRELLDDTQRETGADGRPREKFLQDVVISRAFAHARLRRGLAARQAARGLGRRPVPRRRRHRRLLQPLRLADPRVRGLLPELLAQLRGRRRRTWCAPSPARRPRSRKAARGAAAGRRTAGATSACARSTRSRRSTSARSASWSTLMTG